MLECICCEKLHPPQWEGPDDKSFINPIKCKMVTAHLKLFVVTLLLVTNMKVEDAAVQMAGLNAMGLTGLQVAGARCQHSITKKKW